MGTYFKYVDARRVVDILRCSYCFDSIADVYEGIQHVITYLKVVVYPGIPVNKYLWIKDRFKHKVGNGYRDVILMVKVGKVWTEMQFHYQPCLDLKNRLQHDVYETLRNLPKSGEIEKLMTDDSIECILRSS